jgi:hypothetical protein
LTTALEYTVPIQLHQTAELIVLVTPMLEAHRQWQGRHQGAWEAVEDAVRDTEDEPARATRASQSRTSTYTAREVRLGYGLY